MGLSMAHSPSRGGEEKSRKVKAEEKEALIDNQC